MARRARTLIQQRVMSLLTSEKKETDAKGSGLFKKSPVTWKLCSQARLPRNPFSPGRDHVFCARSDVISIIVAVSLVRRCSSGTRESSLYFLTLPSRHEAPQMLAEVGARASWPIIIIGLFSNILEYSISFANFLPLCLSFWYLRHRKYLLRSLNDHRSRSLMISCFLQLD